MCAYRDMYICAQIHLGAVSVVYVLLAEHFSFALGIRQDVVLALIRLLPFTFGFSVVSGCVLIHVLLIHHFLNADRYYQHL